MSKNSVSYFTSPFAIAKRLEMRLSVSPATPFSDAPLPNHTKFFERLNLFNSMEHLAPPPPPRSKHGLKLVCYVNIVYGYLKSENSQDFA